MTEIVKNFEDLYKTSLFLKNKYQNLSRSADITTIRNIVTDAKKPDFFSTLQGVSDNGIAQAKEDLEDFVDTIESLLAGGDETTAKLFFTELYDELFSLDTTNTNYEDRINNKLATDLHVIESSQNPSIVSKKTKELDALLQPKVDLSDGNTTASQLLSFQQSDTAIISAISTITDAVGHVLDQRILSNITGVSAGQETNNYGAWIKGIYSSGSQKQYKLIPAYNLSQKGLSMGAEIGEESR